MTVGLLVITDGRADYLSRMVNSLDRHPFSVTVVVDDSGDEAYGRFVDSLFLDAIVIHHPERQGLVAAVNTGWRELLDLPVEFVFHVEEDFVFHDQPPLADMARLLDEHPKLANIVLKRQPWSPVEIAAGGIIEMNRDDYWQDAGYVDHSRIFSLNPCLYDRRIMAYGMPPEAEAGITQLLVADGWHFGIYGQIGDPPRCEHIGAQRSPAWKL